MVEVVYYLKSIKIAHRDLKPANFLLKGDKIILIDFGLSKEGMETCIEMKSKCGSERYMAPEIFNEEFYNEKIDDFSLAVILY